MDDGWKKVGGGREGGRKQGVELTTKAEMRRRKMWKWEQGTVNCAAILS